VMCSPARFSQARLGNYPFAGALVVAQKVAALTSPGDPVYVAGSEPEILACAKRQSPSRFITSYPMMLPTVLARKYQLEAIHDLQVNPPKLIVFVQRQDS
jgi:hypothetical protein